MPLVVAPSHHHPFVTHCALGYALSAACLGIVWNFKVLSVFSHYLAAAARLVRNLSSRYPCVGASARRERHSHRIAVHTQFVGIA